MKFKLAFPTIKLVGRDCTVLGFNSCVTSSLKPTNRWHLMILKCKKGFSREQLKQRKYIETVLLH